MNRKNTQNEVRGKLDKAQRLKYTMGSDTVSETRDAMYALLQEAHSGKIDTPTLYEKGTALTKRLKGGNGQYLPEDMRYVTDFISRLRYAGETEQSKGVDHYLELLKRDKPERTDFLARLKVIAEEYRSNNLSSGQLHFQLDELGKEFDNYADQIAELIGDLEAECEDDTEMILNH